MRINLCETVQLVLEANRALAERDLVDQEVIRETLHLPAECSGAINEFLARRICRDLDVPEPR